jgi:hypothetical protein
MLYEQKAWIYAEFGNIICISVGRIVEDQGVNKLKIKSRTGHDEAQLLWDFCQDLHPYLNDKDVLLCGHNGKEFDFPRITRRLIVHGMILPKILDNQGKKPREIWHLDTMEMRKCGDIKSYTSLNLLAHLFGLPTPKDDIDGSQVSSVYRNQWDIQRIAHYCEKDVLTTANIYMKMTRRKVLERI